jgi:hypothetical protein
LDGLQLDDGPAQRRPLVQHGEEAEHAREQRAECVIATIAEIGIELEGHRMREQAERDEPVERSLDVGDGLAPEVRDHRQAEGGVHDALDREHEEDPLVAGEPPVDRVVDRGAREEAGKACVH